MGGSTWDSTGGGVRAGRAWLAPGACRHSCRCSRFCPVPACSSPCRLQGGHPPGCSISELGLPFAKRPRPQPRLSRARLGCEPSSETSSTRLRAPRPAPLRGLATRDGRGELRTPPALCRPGCLALNHSDESREQTWVCAPRHTRAPVPLDASPGGPLPHGAFRDDANVHFCAGWNGDHAPTSRAPGDAVSRCSKEPREQDGEDPGALSGVVPSCPRPRHQPPPPRRPGPARASRPRTAPTPAQLSAARVASRITRATEKFKGDSGNFQSGPPRRRSRGRNALNHRLA